MEKLYKYRKIIAIILGFITTAFITINLDKNTTNFYTQDFGNNIIYIVLVALYAIMIEKFLTIKDKKE